LTLAILAKGLRLPLSALTYAAAQLLRIVPRVRISRAVGRLCEQELPSPVSRFIQAAYCRAYGVNMTEVAPRNDAYPSFDAFFTRPLRHGARYISGDPVVSPADGMLSATGPVDPGCRIFVKGQPYEVSELIGDAQDASRYIGGSFAVVYLSPRDYHRVHSPVDGHISLLRGMPGDLYPVNTIGERHVPRLLVRNNRVAIVVDTEGQGRVTVVMVGAMIVGKISISVMPDPVIAAGTHVVSPPIGVKRGEEIGMFHLGSTAVLLFEPTVTIARQAGTVRYGESLLKSS
jgi:phosphatidylserine decarboxylase